MTDTATLTAAADELNAYVAETEAPFSFQVSDETSSLEMWLVEAESEPMIWGYIDFPIEDDEVFRARPATEDAEPHVVEDHLQGAAQLATLYSMVMLALTTDLDILMLLFG